MLYMKDHCHLTFGHDWQWMPKISSWHRQDWIESFRFSFWPEVCQRDMERFSAAELNLLLKLKMLLKAVKGLKCFFSLLKGRQEATWLECHPGAGLSPGFPPPPPSVPSKGRGSDRWQEARTLFPPRPPPTRCCGRAPRVLAPSWLKVAAPISHFNYG